MVNIHKINFNQFNNQQEVWNIYRKLKGERKGQTMLTILKEIHQNQEFFKSNYLSKLSYSELIDKENIKTLIEILEITTNETVKQQLEDKVNKIISKICF